MTEHRVQLLERKLALAEEIDTLLEIGMRTRASLERIAPRALDLLVKAVGGEGAALLARDETGASVIYEVGVLMDVDDLEKRVQDQGTCLASRSGKVVVGRRLDVSDAYVGSGFVWGDFGDDTEDVAELIESWAEQFDNFVGAVAEARRKQAAIAAISDALKAPILEKGIAAAVEAFSKHVAFDDLVLACRSEMSTTGPPSTYLVLIDGEIRYTSDTRPDARVEALLTGALDQLLRPEEGLDERSLGELGWRSPHRVDLPIRGLDDSLIVGRLVVGFRGTEPTPFASDLTDRFADYLRQRVVDFSREWRRLSRHFSQPVVERLLREPDYNARYLAPREANAAILFADIAGFTRVSEQILKEPAKIAKLIDVWSRTVVDIIWDSGGVYDKMVGDCIIAMWGPPFYGRTADATCSAAVDAARMIRDWTRRVGGELGMDELEAGDLGVSIGLNYAPLFVGCIGAGEDFTGFSSGMNNTARLQGMAERDEILCMSSMVDILGAEVGFGEERSEAAKNVAEPLRFRALLS